MLTISKFKNLHDPGRKKTTEKGKRKSRKEKSCH